MTIKYGQYIYLGEYKIVFKLINWPFLCCKDFCKLKQIFPATWSSDGYKEHTDITCSHKDNIIELIGNLWSCDTIDMNHLSDWRHINWSFNCEFSFSLYLLFNSSSIWSFFFVKKKVIPVVKLKMNFQH